MKTQTHNTPIRSAMKVLAGPSGIEAAPFLFHPDMTHKPTPWKADWIWLHEMVFPQLQTSRPTVFCDETGLIPALALFRREFHLDGPVRSAHAWVSGDVKYRFFVNGEPVGRGPAEVGGDYGNTETLGYWFYDTYDLGDRLMPGSNVLCAEVLLQPDMMADYSMGHGGFLLELDWICADGTAGTWTTDETWKGIANPAFLNITSYDARLEPLGWHEAGYDDAGWAPVSVLEKACMEPDAIATGNRHRWPLLPREIPPLMEVRIHPKEVHEPFREQIGALICPEALLSCRGDGVAMDVKGASPGEMQTTIVPFGAPCTFWLDFGKIHSGRLYAEMEGPSGTHVRFCYQEIAGRTDRSFDLVLRDGRQMYEGIRLESVRYLQVTVSNLTGPVVLHEIAIHFSSYPVRYLGGFDCSDPDLVRIYEAGRWSNQICRQGYHLDSPIHQEALGCTGDYMIESLMNYMTFGDPWLTRLDLIRTARLLDVKDSVMFHTSYSLLWLQMLMDYHLFTGDGSLLGQMDQIAYHLLARFTGYVGVSGLIEKAPNYMFMDWVPVGQMNLHHPPKTLGQGYLSAFFIKALDNGALLATHLGDRDRAAGYARQAKNMRKAFHRDLWNEARGLYMDGKNGREPTVSNTWLPADAEGTFYSQHTNSLAVLYGIAPADRCADIMRQVFTDDTLIQAQPYFLHFVLEAADAAGVFGEYGLTQMRRWKDLLAECPGSLKEVWAGFACDYSHAWGGTPTWQLPSKILGITPLAPGFTRFRVRPCPGDLSWASGSVPTPHGPVLVSWNKEEGKASLHVQTPVGVEAVVETGLLGETDVVCRTSEGSVP